MVQRALARGVVLRWRAGWVALARGVVLRWRAGYYCVGARGTIALARGVRWRWRGGWGCAGARGGRHHVGVVRAAGARDGQIAGGFKLFDMPRDVGGGDARPFGEPGDRRPALAVVIGVIGQAEHDHQFAAGQLLILVVPDLGHQLDAHGQRLPLCGGSQLRAGRIVARPGLGAVCVGSLAWPLLLT